MNDINSVIKGADRAITLVIREEPFTRESLKKMDGQQIVYKKREIRRSEEFRLSSGHRFFYTLPMKLINPGKFTSCPGIELKRVSSNLYNIRPKFTRISDKFFLEKFKVLDKAIAKKVKEMDRETRFHYMTILEEILTPDLELMQSNTPDRNETKECFKRNVAIPCVKLMKFLIGSLKMEDGVQYAKSEDEHPQMGQKVFFPGITFKELEDNLLIVDMKCPSLKRFIKDDGTLKENNSDFNDILKTICSNLILSNLACALLSDFETTIFLRINLKESNLPEPVRSDNVCEPYVNLPLLYKIIYNTDTGITLQGVVASLIYESYLEIQQERVSEVD